MTKANGSGWETVETVRGNWQRLRRHRFSEPIFTEPLRIVAQKTNGLDHARICEVHAYPE